MKNFILTFQIIILFFGIVWGQNLTRGQKIVAGEYYFDHDPGPGNGTPITANYGVSELTVNFSVQIPKGSILYFRFKSSDGEWSAPTAITNDHPFGAGASLVGGEYFINTDPGFGNGTSFSIDSHGNIDIPSISLHKNDKLFLRVKDSFGRWSAPTPVQYRFRRIIFAQYYIKFNNGTKTQMLNMTIENNPPNSAIFTATDTVNYSITSQDSIFVQIQSDDYLMSPLREEYTVTDINQEENNIPEIFSLNQNYPNPFNPTTTIQYDIPKATHVRIDIYNVLGQKIRTLVNENRVAGSYKVVWNGRNDSGQSAPSGVYFYVLSTPEFKQTRKMLLLK